MTQRKIPTMTKLSPLLAVALALTAGSAYAESSQHLCGSARPAFPALVANSSAESAPAAPGSSAASLSALLRDWDRAGFKAPMKPAQARVYGRAGYVTSGSEYHAMVSLIRSAIRDSAEGRDQDALTKIARARALLGQ